MMKVFQRSKRAIDLWLRVRAAPRIGQPSQLMSSSLSFDRLREPCSFPLPLFSIVLLSFSLSRSLSLSPLSLSLPFLHTLTPHAIPKSCFTLREYSREYDQRVSVLDVSGHPRGSLVLRPTARDRHCFFSCNFESEHLY